MREEKLHRMDATVPTRELQWCSNLSDFVGALNDDTLLPLVRAIDDSPERPDRSRRKSRRLLQSVVFYLYGRYPGTEAPRSVDELYRRLNDPKDALVQLLIFDDRPACPNTMLKWLRNIDDHPDLVEQALRAISDMLPWNPPPKEYP